MTGKKSLIKFTITNEPACLRALNTVKTKKVRKNY